MDFATDLPLMLADFGTPATLAGAAVSGIFEAPQVFAGAGLVGATGTEPSYLLPSSSVPSQVHNASLVVATGLYAGTYRVRQSGPDEPGLTRLMLERVA